MLRRAHENGRSQPANQSISQYKATFETQLKCMALPSISETINYFYVTFLVDWSGKEEEQGSRGRRIKGWFYLGQNIMYPIMKKDRTIKTTNGHNKKLGERVSAHNKEHSLCILAFDQKFHK